MAKRLEITLKPELRDPEGEGIRARANEYFGIRLEQCRTVHVLTFDVNLTDDRFETARTDIFTNPVTQESSFAPLAEDFDFALWVGLRPGVRDTVGSTAQEAIEDYFKITFAPGECVYTSKLYLMSGAELSRDQVETIGKKLLANDIIQDVKQRLSTVDLPRGYSWSFTGEQEDQSEAMDFLAKAFVACLFIIFLVLVTQFNSVVTPLIILTSVLLSLMGVFLGLLVTGTAFGVIMTGVGVISLAGVVVNNAIVLIDYFEQLKARGMDVGEALVQAGLTRLRPVLLTAVTTILGMLPMATGVSFNFLELRWDIGGESTQWWGAMAVAVIFGLAIATLLTLVVVPVMCSLKESLTAHTAARQQARAPEALPQPSPPSA